MKGKKTPEMISMIKQWELNFIGCGRITLDNCIKDEWISSSISNLVLHLNLRVYERTFNNYRV